MLHFSLLRFVYDLGTMERKKSKHALLFPETLDMDQFVNAHATDGKKRKRSDNNKYHLRGVLLHRGPSAYHGHYEAQVFDMKYAFYTTHITVSCMLMCSPCSVHSETELGTSLMTM